MEDRISNDHRPYPRDRDRDQRMPTFHMLLDHDKHHHEYHFHHQSKREDHRKAQQQPEVHRGQNSSSTAAAASRGRKTGKTFEPAANFEKGRRPTTASRSPRGSIPADNGVGNTVPLVHKKRTSDESVSSLSSSRGPACNFSQFYVNKVEAEMNERRERSKEKQMKCRRKSPGGYEDEDIMEEATDVLVWNASKKTSRSNILCPLTESEQLDMALQNLEKLGVKRKIERERRARSSSIPKSAQLSQLPQVHQTHLTHHQQQQNQNHRHQYPNLGVTNSLLFNSEDMGQTELLDETLPPLIRETSSTVSLTSSTYSIQIALVTQQLEQIQQAQNDILKQLGDDISKVSNENEKLKEEIDHVRNQNESLLKVVQETTEQLERMKHIFRTRAIPIPHPDSREEEHHHHNSHNQNRDHDRPRSSSPNSAQVDGSKPDKHRSRQSRSRSKERTRADDNTSTGSGNKEPSTRHSRNHSHSHSPRDQKKRGSGSGENPIDLNQNSVEMSSPKRRSNRHKKVLEEDSDNEEEKMKHGCYVGLGISLEEDENSNSSRHDPYDPDRRRRRRRRSGSGDKTRGDGNISQSWEEDMLRRERSHNKLMMGEQNNNGTFGRRESRRGISPKNLQQSPFSPPPNPCQPQRPREQAGCLCGMFNCCMPKPAYEKDCEEDINILHDCPE